MSEEKEIVEIKIPNNGLFAYYPVIFASLLVFTVAIFISQDVKHDLFVALAAITTVGIIGTLGIKLIEPKGSPNASWGSPDIYVIENRTLKIYSYSTKKAETLDLSNVYKIKYVNHKYRKYIDIDYNRNGKDLYYGFKAPLFEKCNDDWQRLFEEIKKRIPDDAEVIIK